MTSGFYLAGKNGLLNADIDMASDTIYVTLVDVADYTVNLSTDNAYDDVPSGARVASGELLSKSVTNNVFDAANTVLSAVTGDPCEALVIWKNTGVESTSTLIAYIDGFTVTPGGGDITIQWDNGASKIFAL